MIFADAVLIFFSALFFIGMWIFHYLRICAVVNLCQIGILVMYIEVVMGRLNLNGLLWYVFIGSLLGGGVFCVSFIATTPNPIKSLWAFLKNGYKYTVTSAVKKNVPIQFVTAVWEELFWRGGLQSILSLYSHIYVAISFTAILFWIAHLHRFKNSVSRMLELLVFSFLLGIIFEASDSIALCITIHFIRNILIIVFRSYVLKQDIELK